MTEIFGYTFKTPALLEEALTTPACKMDRPETKDNQRLEFLGDAVLGLLSAACIYRGNPSGKEGDMSIHRAHMVSTRALCAAAGRLNLVPLLRRNRNASPLPGDSKTIADAVEAIVGAAYLDGGLEAARVIFRTLGLDANAELGSWCENPKGELQVRAQAMTPVRHPAYEVLSMTGKSHAPVFTVRVTVEGVGSAEATAHTRQDAEVRAAATLLNML